MSKIDRLADPEGRDEIEIDVWDYHAGFYTMSGWALLGDRLQHLGWICCRAIVRGSGDGGHICVGSALLKSANPDAVEEETTNGYRSTGGHRLNSATSCHIRW